MFKPNLPGKENLPGPRGSRIQAQRDQSFSNQSSPRPPNPRMKQTYGYNGWRGDPYGPWANGGNHIDHGPSSPYIAPDSNLSIDNTSAGELTPLPVARHPNGAPSSNHPSVKPRFWTPQTDSSPKNAPTKTFAGKDLYNRLMSSIRRRKKQEAATTQSQPENEAKATVSATPMAKKPPKPVTEDVTARVLLLDGEEVSMKLNKKALGSELLRRICDGQDLVETDYFGITCTDKKLGTWFWLDLDKKIISQATSVADWQFYFQVKFYPPEPTMLQDETTRYQLVLQVRQDVYTGKLPCSWVTQALLGSFIAQSELGDYDPNVMGSGTDYLRQFEFVRNPTNHLLQKIMELHRTHKGMKPGQADIKYLETAKRLDLYGLDLHPARDMENVEIYIGVGYSGIVIYRDRVRIGRFAWPKVLRISYKKNLFYLKIRPDYTEPEEAEVGFQLLNPQLAKRLWKTAVEHHSFFRLKEAPTPKRGPLGFLGVSSRFQYSGRTFFQYRTTQIDRPPAMADDDVRPDGRPRNPRTASVPAALNRAGIQYKSMHSLNRTHPRDMTMGKAQSSDYLGPTIPAEDQLPVVSVIQPPPSHRPIQGATAKPLQPAKRRNPRPPPPVVSRYPETSGSALEVPNSRLEGSLSGSEMRGADYEVPRRLEAHEYSAYSRDDFSILSGDAEPEDGDAQGNSIIWSATNSYNPAPSPDSWMPDRQPPPRVSPSPPPPSPFFPRARGFAQNDYANVGDSDPVSNPLRSSRRVAKPRNKYENYRRTTSDEEFL